MGSKTGISWTNATWNPWQGCMKVSEGCKNCYMYREKKQYGQDPMTVVRSKPNTFNAPLRWARNGELPDGARIFVCSWSDFFHKDADEWRAEACEIIRSLPQYNFLIPTKRIERVSDIYWPRLSNIWLGVSVENQETANQRIPLLRDAPATIKWISAEPLLGSIFFGIMNLQEAIDWVVVGGESGPGCRPMETEWARQIIHDCREAGVAVFIKQLGGWPDTRHELSGFPEDLRIREFPK